MVTRITIATSTIQRANQPTNGRCASARAFQRLIACCNSTNSMRICRTSTTCVCVMPMCVGVWVYCIHLYMKYMYKLLIAHYVSICGMLSGECCCLMCSMLAQWSPSSFRAKCVSLLKFLHLSSVWLSKSRCERHKLLRFVKRKTATILPVWRWRWGNSQVTTTTTTIAVNYCVYRAFALLYFIGVR